MKECVMAAMIGFVLGVYVGYQNENELDDLYHQGKRTKRKAMKNMHKAYDRMCDCMDMD